MYIHIYVLLLQKDIIKSIHKLRPKDCKIRYRDVLRIMGRSLSDNNKIVMKPFRYYYKENSI